MPMDIRAYFTKTPESKKPESKTSGKNTLEDSVNKNRKSRKRVFIDSDSDEEKPFKQKEKEPKNKRSKERSSNNGDTSKYFEVSNNDISNILGNTPIKRSEQPKAKKKMEDPNLEMIEDIDWDNVPDFPNGNKKSDAMELDVTPKDKGSLKKEKSEDYVSKPTESPNKSLETNKVSNLTISRLHELSPEPSPEKKKVKGNESKKQKLSFLERENKPSVTSVRNKKKSPIKNSPKSTIQNLTKSPEINTSNTGKKNASKSPTKRLFEDPISKSSPSPLKNLPKKELLNCGNNKGNEHIDKEGKSHDPQYSLWVEKYKPTTLKQIIGQQGDKSNVNKLVKWLSNWYKNQSGTKKLTKPSPWAKDDSGAYFKAALLSGPPGVGKTTTAHLVCKELGLDMVEFNASDTRSKKSLQVEIRELLSSKTIASYATGGEVSSKHVLIMDEVDGMAGNEDRGGVQELIMLIKSSRIPVICMCNDRNHPKIRSLANYCFDLRFSKPRTDQIRGAMMSVCFKEGLKMKPDVLVDIITSTNQDIRLILNHLSVLSAQAALNLPLTSKYVKLGPWDVLRKVFSKEEHKNMSIFDKCDLFFFDYSIAPLFVQENYLNVKPHSEESKTKKGNIALFAKAAESIAYGDLVDNKIRTHQAWGLLPVQAVFSSLLPGEYLAGHMGGQINFPSWLGKNSRRGKLDRFCQEVQAHTRLKASGSKEAINLDYSYMLKEKVSRPLLSKGTEGIEESISVMKEYCILREDIESLSEITAWPGYPDPFSKIESKVKASFTRAYNKNPIVTPFSITAAVKKGRGVASTEEVELGDENLEDADNEEEDGEGDDIAKDAMIMVKKKPNKADKKEQHKKEGGGSKPHRGKRKQK